MEENHILRVIAASGKMLEYHVPRMKAIADDDVVRFEPFSKKDVVKFISDNIVSGNVIELNDCFDETVYLNASQILQFKVL